MKRWFETVRVAERAAAEEADTGAYFVTLDGRPVLTPARNPLRLPARPLADAISAEWAAQGDEIDPGRMPLMAFAAAAIDRVAVHRDAVIAEIAGYGGADLLCHRADGPADLVARQQAAWQPVLDWARDRHQVFLVVTAGVMPVAQPEAALAAVRAAVARRSDMALSGLHRLTTVTGSVVIGLAVADGHWDAQAAWDASQIDEAFQAEKWGEDEEAVVRRAGLRAELGHAARFLEMCAE